MNQSHQFYLLLFDLLKGIDIVDIGGNKSEIQHHLILVKLPAVVELGTAGLRADSRVAVVDIDYGLLQRLELIVVICKGEHMGSEV